MYSKDFTREDMEAMDQLGDKVREGAEEAYEAIGHGVVSGYKRIEDSVVSGYKKIENGVVGGFTKMTDKIVEKVFAKEGETVEDAKARLNSGKNNETTVKKG